MDSESSSQGAGAVPGGATGPHVSSVGTYVVVFVTLLVLTAVTTWVGYLELGVFNNIVALCIAVTKGCLVVLFFMHARHTSRLVQIVLLSGLL